MVARLQIPFDADELEALRSAAIVEGRGLKEQARFMIRRELELRGFVKQTGYLVENDDTAALLNRLLEGMNHVNTQR